MVLTPKDPIIFSQGDSIRIFLAGTIDNGNSVDWQAETIKLIHNKLGLKLLIFNPRNEEWNTTLEQSMKVPEFANQVEWEYDAMCTADEIIMNFLPNSKSPITLLELGLFADADKLHVLCPDEFYRKGNVEFICEKNGIPMYETIDQIVNTIKNRYKL